MDEQWKFRRYKREELMCPYCGERFWTPIARAVHIGHCSFRKRTFEVETEAIKRRIRKIKREI